MLILKHPIHFILAVVKNISLKYLKILINANIIEKYYIVFKIIQKLIKLQILQKSACNFTMHEQIITTCSVKLHLDRQYWLVSFLKSITSSELWNLKNIDINK